MSSVRGDEVVIRLSVLRTSKQTGPLVQDREEWRGVKVHLYSPPTEGFTPAVSETSLLRLAVVSDLKNLTLR